MSDPASTAIPETTVLDSEKKEAPLSKKPETKKEEAPRPRQAVQLSHLAGVYLMAGLALALVVVLFFTNRSYHTKISELQTEITNAEKASGDKVKQIGDLEGEIQRLKNASLSQPDLLGKLKEANDQLAVVQAAAQKSQTELTEKIKSLQAKLPDTLTSTTTWDSLPPVLQEQARTLGFTREALRPDDTRTLRLAEQNSLLTAENTSLAQKLRDLEVKIAQELSKSQKDALGLTAQNTQLTAEKSSLQEALRLKEQNSVALTDERDALKLRIEEVEKLKSQEQIKLQSDLKAANDTIKSLRKKVRELESPLKDSKGSPK